MSGINWVDPLYLFSDPPEVKVEPMSVEAPATMPDPDSQKRKISSRKRTAQRSGKRSGRRSTVLSQDDKMGGSQ